MKPHTWSDPVYVYEGIAKLTCSGCNASILSCRDFMPSPGELIEQNLPEDCDKAVLVVIHEEYTSSDGIDPWLGTVKHG